MTTEQIACVAHETNRAYCAAIGDWSQPAWISAPEWQRTSAINGVEAHLAALDRGDEISQSASHDLWLSEKSANGWRYGPVKDADRKEHPCCVPYSELPVEQQAKDALFGAVVRALWSNRVIELVAHRN